MVLAGLIMCAGLPCQSLPLSHFAAHSRLSSGKWVKISLPSTGVYELSAEELASMGFSDPARVAVYGNGGYPLSEVLDGSAPDDLQPVASQLADGKLYFYGKGPIEMLLDTENTSSLLAFRRNMNAYSMNGCYFLTEEASPLRINEVDSQPPTTNLLESSYNYWYHERELMTVTFSGKELLGEDMLTADVNLPFTLPLISSPSVVVAAKCAGASQSLKTSVQNDNMTILGTVTTDYESNWASFPASKASVAANREEQRYNTAMPHTEFTFSTLTDHGTLTLGLRLAQGSTSAITLARLDHAIITYQRQNAFASSTEPQFTMWFNNLTSQQTIALPGIGYGTLVWDVTQSATPVCYHLWQANNDATLTPGRNWPTAQYVAFNPQLEQLKISSFEPVENQDLHALATPDLLIVTNSVMMEQAERVADLHRTHDGMTVHVVDQEQVFNEFSSGTPDAMGIRLLCKMLYDRGPEKFKNLLMFGTGLFDNRQITSTRANTLITYESTTSNDEATSNGTDDFFGFLTDNSGGAPQRELLCIGVGRMLPRTPQEAKTDVDKLVEYVTTPDYGVWHNNALMIADEGTSAKSDIGVHIFQAEGINNIIETDKNTGLHTNKVYVETFPRSSTETLESDVTRRSCIEGKRHLIESLTAGQYFMTYVGHAGGSVLASDSKLWYARDVRSYQYNHWPIVTTACCNVARFDSGQEGISETMYHQRHGGAIALLTAARDVKSDDNDNLNRAFTNALFATATSTETLTLGEVYKNTKRSFGTMTEYNKLAFFLLGDPAIKVNIPRRLFTVTSINGTPADSGEVTVSPQQRLTIEANVLTRDGQRVDNTFTGPATLTLYGPKKYFITYQNRVSNTWSVRRDIYLERPLLGQVQGDVVNGHFTGEVIVPRNELPDGNDPLQLSLFAHKTGTDEMVNGTYDELVLGPYSDSLAVTDDTPPEIEAMFLNDENTFAHDATVGSDATLYVRLTDDTGINTQANAPGSAMRLALDGNKTLYYTVKDYAASSNGGRNVEVAFPLTGLSMGRHTLSFTAQDMAGKTATHTISFVVASANSLSLAVDERPATTQATFSIAANALPSIPNVTIKVTDTHGNLVWSTNSQTFPVTWNLTDHTGQRVPAGIYKFYGTYSTSGTSGGTDLNELIVIDPLTARLP